MPKRLLFLCVSFLLISMLWVFTTRGDMIVPTWGEAIQNDCYLNIQIEDSGFTIHQRIQMKL